MKSYICLTAMALLIATAGCAPRLAETPLGTEEQRWETYIKKSYPAWKAPQTIPPENTEGKIESPATTIEKPLPTVKDELKLVEDIIVVDKKGKLLIEMQTSVEIKENFQIYVVQKNDTLWKISAKFYKDGRQWEKIQTANNVVLKGSDQVRPGMTLRIPLP